MDELLRRNDTTATDLMDQVYSARRVTWRELHPFVQIHSTLSQIVIPVSFAVSLSDQQLDGFSIKSEHELVFRKDGEAKTPTSRQVIRVLRNALAHLSDFASRDVAPNISFEEGIVCFRAQPPNRGKKSSTASLEEVVFKTEPGFVNFLRDLFRVVRKANSPDSATSPVQATEQETARPASSGEEQTDSSQNLQGLQAEGWRLIQEFAPFRPEEVAEFPREVTALKLWAKAKLYELEGLSPQSQEWQAAVAMAIEAAYRIGVMERAP